MRRYGIDGRVAGKLVPAGQGELLLEQVTVIDGMGGPPRMGASVLVRDGRIAAVDAEVHAQGDVRRLDTRGLVVMPGLIDCHVHLTGDHTSELYRRYLDATPRARIVRAAAHANLLLSVGFTTVRNLGHGHPAHIGAVQRAIAKGVIAGPRILSAGWSISQTGGHGNLRIWPYDLVERLRPRSAFADGPAATRALVERNIAEGAEAIKLYGTEGVIYTPDRLSDIPNFSPVEIRAIAAAAHRRGVRVASHSTGRAGALQAVENGVDTLEHGPHEMDEKLLRVMRERKTVLVPTLSVFHWAASEGVRSSYPAWVAERAARHLEGRFAMVRRARDLGVVIALGTDTGGPPRGGQNALELELLVRAGLTPMDAIVAGTHNAAIAIGREKELGVIRRGAIADLLVLRGDPLADITVLRRPENIAYIVQGESVRG